MHPNNVPFNPAASVADIAGANAAAGRARAASLNGITTGANPLILDTPLAAPSGLILAAGLVTPKASGLFQVSLVLNFTLGAAASVALEALIEPATSIAGGTQLGTTALRYRAGGAVTITGAGSPTGTITSNEAIATGQIANVSMPLSYLLVATPNVTNAIVLTVTSAGTLSSETLSLSYYELP